MAITRRLNKGYTNRIKCTKISLVNASSYRLCQNFHLHLVALPVLGDREHVEFPVKDELRRARRCLFGRGTGTGKLVVFDLPRGRAGEGISPSISHVPQDKTRTCVGFRWLG